MKRQNALKKGHKFISVFQWLYGKVKDHIKRHHTNQFSFSAEPVVFMMLSLAKLKDEKRFEGKNLEIIFMNQKALALIVYSFMQLYKTLQAQLSSKQLFTYFFKGFNLKSPP